MSLWVTPARARALGPVSRAIREVIEGIMLIMLWSWLSAAPNTHTGALRQLRARSAVVTKMAAPESVTRQQSSRWKGQETQRESW